MRCRAPRRIKTERHLLGGNTRAGWQHAGRMPALLFIKGIVYRRIEAFVTILNKYCVLRKIYSFTQYAIR